MCTSLESDAPFFVATQIPFLSDLDHVSMIKICLRMKCEFFCVDDAVHEESDDDEDGQAGGLYYTVNLMMRVRFENILHTTMNTHTNECTHHCAWRVALAQENEPATHMTVMCEGNAEISCADKQVTAPRN